jgi:antitoxin ParD1/3/4
MAKVAKRAFSLPSEQAAYIDAKVEDGAYASGSEVVRAGLRALQERDAAVERWLSEEVGSLYDAMKANPQNARFRPDRSLAKHAPDTLAARAGAEHLTDVSALSIVQQLTGRQSVLSPVMYSAACHG